MLQGQDLLDLPSQKQRDGWATLASQFLAQL